MKMGPMHLIVEGDECLMCCECLRYIKNATAFLRGRVVKDRATNTKYTIAVVYCGPCEVSTSIDREEAEDGGI